MAKKISGGGPAIREIKSFDDWTVRVKKHVDFKRGDGQIDRFSIRSLSAAQTDRIAKEYNERRPTKPEPLRDPDGRIKEDRHFEKRMQKYQDEITQLDKWMQYQYILLGLDLEIPGKTEDEKIENMKRVIAGDAPKLFAEIVKLSNMGNEDVDFF